MEYANLNDLLHHTVCWQFDEANLFGQMLARIIETEDGWTCWNTICEDFSFLIRGKIRNTRQHICNPLIEICLCSLPKDGLVLKMDWETFYKINLTLLRHQFQEDKEGYAIVKVNEDAFAIQRDGVDWYNKNKGDSYYTILHFQREFFDKYRETVVSMVPHAYPIPSPYNRLCLFEKNLFLCLADKTDKWHTTYTIENPPPEPVGQNTTFEEAPIITDAKKELLPWLPPSRVVSYLEAHPDDPWNKRLKASGLM